MESLGTVRAVSLPDVLAQELQGESVLLNVRNGRYYGLDEVGTRMWTVMTSSKSLREACDKLLAEYDIDPDRLENDVTKLAEDLVEHGLVEIQNA